MSDLVNVINDSFTVIVSGLQFIVNIAFSIPTYLTKTATLINNGFPNYLKYPLLFMCIIAVMISIKRLVHE